MSSSRTIRQLLVLASMVGCVSSVPPQDLLDARNAYDRASRGPSAQLNPAELHTAQDSLAAAERSLQEKGDTEETRTLAYAAERQIQTVEARTREMQANQQREQLVAQMNASALAALGRANRQLATQEDRLKVEGARRQDAEQRAALAAAALVRIASVKQEPRGLVITLSGSVLFTSGQAILLPSAQAKLSEVAAALSKQDPQSKIVVEGHTDSQGADVFNRDLPSDGPRTSAITSSPTESRPTESWRGASGPIGRWRTMPPRRGAPTIAASRS